MAIDRVRFRRRIHQSELILAPILNHKHRLMIRMKRYDIQIANQHKISITEIMKISNVRTVVHYTCAIRCGDRFVEKFTYLSFSRPRRVKLTSWHTGHPAERETGTTRQPLALASKVRSAFQCGNGNLHPVHEVSHVCLLSHRTLRENAYAETKT